MRERRIVVAERGGFSDLFAPIAVGGRMAAILITGPFSTARPGAAAILERWRRLTGRQGHTGDPEFVHYVSTTLSTLVLEPRLLSSYKRLLLCFARLLAGEERGGAVLAAADTLRAEVEQARFVERVWDVAHAMVDIRTCRRWTSAFQSADLAGIGMSRPADDVVVGLVVNRRPGLEPVDEIVRRDAFQRACVELARRARDAASGRIGDHGVTFLGRGRRALIDLAGRSAAMARRRFDLGLHLGISALPGDVSLAERYAAALQAAESALVKGLDFFEIRSEVRVPLVDMRRHLAALVEERPRSLPARFDRYVEAVARHTGFRLDPARAHLEVGFAQIAESLVGSGTLEEKGLADLHEALEQSARDARTVAELGAAYRRAVADLCEAVERPAPAHRDRSIRRAVEHMRQHYAEPLTLASVARVAGFAPCHFSTLFRRHEGMTFSRHVCRLRLERAKELLTRTDLNLERIARLSGFRSREYFARVFRSVVGKTPMAWRRRTRIPGSSGTKETSR
jgi:AraC-like DNA-binding protein